MGNCVGAGSPEDREAKSRSSAIDRQLREDRKEYENTIKILLLGKSLLSQCVLFKWLASVLRTTCTLCMITPQSAHFIVWKPRTGQPNTSTPPPPPALHV